MFVESATHKQKSKNETRDYQSLRGQANHTFQWSRGTATCACGRWTLWGASLNSAKRSHAYHRANLPETQRAVSGPDKTDLGSNELITVEQKGSAANATAYVS